ncbi:hypothetical protein CPC08DRAFT_166594 [Agrocybe pediades]|nr:hypothetical protein CPC08DRAFT_166594 [Agrocybe pediades]
MTRSKDNLAAPARATPSHSRTPSPRPNANVGQTDGTATKKIPKRLVALMQELQSRLKEDPIFQSNAFESVHQGLTKAIAATEELSKIGDQTVSNKTWDVAALSFSKVKSSELERLGLHLHSAKRIPRSVQLVEMLKALYARGTESSIMSIADRFSCSETSQRMQGMLEVIGRSLGMMRETTARIIIDQLLLSIFVFLWESDDHIVLLLFTELWISSEADSIVIYNGSNATLVTGLADYAVINISIGAQSNSDATTSAALAQVKSLTDLLKSAVWKQYSESSDGVACQITLVEAKSLIHTDDLENWRLCLKQGLRLYHGA